MSQKAFKANGPQNKANGPQNKSKYVDQKVVINSTKNPRNIISLKEIVKKYQNYY
ncbi:hypothetical protein N9K75_00105 [bacterium]|nr:hypothetical protein [bacterium]